MRRHLGFTLVELLVALFAMSLLAVLSWRGLDGMMRARETTQVRADEVLTLQTGLAQWGADLEHIETLPGMRAVDWNGRVFRVTRRSTASLADGIMVAAWAKRVVGGRTMWARWQSAPVGTRGELEQAWQRADQWALNPAGDAGADEVSICPMDDWQIFYFRENAWTNPQSSDVTSLSIAAAAQQAASAASAPNAANPAQMPDGVRLVLTLSAGQAITGVITRDWVRPQLGGKSP